MVIKTIIQNFEGLSIDREKSAQLILKFNSELKKLGFKKVFVKAPQSREERINPDIIHDGLTLYFNPSYHDINYIERSYYRDSFKLLTEYLNTLGGYDGGSYYYALRNNTFDEQVKLKITHEEQVYHIGDYLPTRNVVIIYFYPFINRWDLNKKNEYILKLLEWISQVVKEYDIKGQDIEQLKEKIFIAKFTKAITQQISNTKSEVEADKNEVENLKPRVAELYNQVTLNEQALRNLSKMLEDIREGLLKKIEEIKKLKFVKKVELTQEGINLEFNKIYIKVKEEDIEMGDYVVNLMPNNIKITNKQPIVYQGTTYHSPHISENSICFGQQKTLAYELLGKMQLKKLTHFLYLYLKSYNPEDTYLSMNYWIKGKQNGGVVPNDEEEEEEEEEEDIY